ncbi:MAG: hypothetical protein R6U28_07910 [Cyclonatronaceae bacterium]
MKKKKLKLMNINEDTSLSRFDMKSMMAGSGGNIICNVGGNHYSCHSPGLSACTDWCITHADNMGTDCLGCAEFPPM